MTFPSEMTEFVLVLHTSDSPATELTALQFFKKTTLKQATLYTSALLFTPKEMTQHGTHEVEK